MDDAPPSYGIDDLAERAGVSRRTVRYYVQQGLLAAPRGLGRGKHYTSAHLETLIRIRSLQEAGTPLAMIAKSLGAAALKVSSAETSAERSAATSAADARDREAGAGSVAPKAGAKESLEAPTLWTHLQLSDDVVLQVRDRVLSEQQRRALIEAVRGILDSSQEQ